MPERAARSVDTSFHADVDGETGRPSPVYLPKMSIDDLPYRVENRMLQCKSGLSVHGVFLRLCPDPHRPRSGPHAIQGQGETPPARDAAWSIASRGLAFRHPWTTDRSKGW